MVLARLNQGEKERKWGYGCTKEGYPLLFKRLVLGFVVLLPRIVYSSFYGHTQEWSNRDRSVRMTRNIATRNHQTKINQNCDMIGFWKNSPFASFLHSFVLLLLLFRADQPQAPKKLISLCLSLSLSVYP